MQFISIYHTFSRYPKIFNNTLYNTENTELHNKLFIPR